MNDLAFEAARALSMVAFFVYGLTCLVTDRMVAEFERYGLGALRKLTGLLEVAGSLGLLAGYFYPPLLVLSSGCLSLLMLFAVGARVRIRDSLPAMLPALVLLAMNAYVFAFSLNSASA